MSCILHIRSKQGEIMIFGQEKCNEQHVAETFPFHVPLITTAIDMINKFYILSSSSSIYIFIIFFVENNAV